jgi:hypothetical protein
MSSVAFEGGVLEHCILVVALGTNAHILLTQMPRHLVDVGIFLELYVSNVQLEHASEGYLQAAPTTGPS